MRLRVDARGLEKAGNAREEYEDACAHAAHASGAHLLAVADGATEAMLSGPWARALVEAWCAHGADAATPAPPAEVEVALVADDEGSATVGWAREAPRRPAFLGAAQAEFAAWRARYLAEREARGKVVQWFEEPGLERGAYATFLGLSLAPPLDEHGGLWEAVAVGDCCVFQLREGTLLRAFPLERAEGFGNSPALLASRADRSAAGLRHLARAEGDWMSGDLFLLASDALAQWLLHAAEEGAPLWETVAAAAADDAFDTLVAKLRADGMRNDDVTLVAARPEVA